MRHQKQKASPAKSSSPLWSLLSNESAVKQWAMELKSASARDFDPETWRLAGHGVIFIGEDAEEAGDLLRCVASEARMSFMPIAPDEVATGFNEWIDAVPDGPCMVFLEPGHWVGNCLEGGEGDLGFPRSPGHDEAQAFEFRKAFRKFLEAGAPNSPLVFVTVLKTNMLLDESLRRAGCFDRRILTPPLRVAEWGQLFVNEMGRSRLDETVTRDLDRLGSVIRSEWRTRRKRDLIRLALHRIGARGNRKISFNDLIHLAANGIEEFDETFVQERVRRSVAIHEAGHLVVAFLISQEKIWPAYASTKKTGGHCGIVITPHEAKESDGSERTYADTLYHIRIALAGRVAEHLALGPENVDAAGATDDLCKAVNLSAQLFGLWGHSLDLSTDEAAASNLSVIGSSPSEWEQSRIDALIAPFLQKQFMFVLELLKENRTLLEKVTDALAENRVMFQEDFLGLA